VVAEYFATAGTAPVAGQTGATLKPSEGAPTALATTPAETNALLKANAISLPQDDGTRRSLASAQPQFKGDQPLPVFDLAPSKPSVTTSMAPVVGHPGAALTLSEVAPSAIPAKPDKGSSEYARPTPAALGPSPAETGALLNSKAAAISLQQANGAQRNLAAALLQSKGDQAAQVFDLAPSERFVAPLSELGQQSAPLRSAEAMLARPEAARMVATQMAEALMRTQNNKVEISLHPEELGRVRMILSTSDLGVSVAIVAERPETLDLMRRHIDQLAKEFREMGYENIGFEFSDRDSRDGASDNTSDTAQNDFLNPGNRRDSDEPVPIQTTRAALSRGLDLRL